MCKINRQLSQTQSVYLSSDILNEMLHALFYLFHNSLQLDAYIAIEAIALKAEEELLVDVILTSNSIKNLIQLSKNEPSLQTALNAQGESNKELNNNNKQNRSASVSSSRKKSDASSPNNRVSPTSSPKSGLYRLHSNEKHSLNDIYVSPSGEIRNAAKRASIKILQQQHVQMQYAELIANSGVPPPVPTSPLPPSKSEKNILDLNVNGK